MANILYLVHLGTFIDDPDDEKHVETLRGLGEQSCVPVMADSVDVDSAKWTDYVPQRRWPLSWRYQREGRRLLASEREVCGQARHGFFATEKETQLFDVRASESAGHVTAMNNGVDANYFSPSPDRASPFPPGDVPVVFTGAMDYWPNVNAVTRFAREAMAMGRPVMAAAGRVRVLAGCSWAAHLAVLEQHILTRQPRASQGPAQVVQ